MSALPIPTDEPTDRGPSPATRWSISPAPLAGAAVVLAGILLAQTAR